MSTFKIPVGITSVTLQDDQLIRIAQTQRVSLTSRRGTLWITIDGQSRDIVLAPGESIEFDGQAPAIVNAIRGSAAFDVRRLPAPARERTRALAKLVASIARIPTRWLATAVNRALPRPARSVM